MCRPPVIRVELRQPTRFALGEKIIVSVVSPLFADGRRGYAARMSITVVITRDDSGAPMTKEHYETGVKFSVEGGDLSIISGKPQLIAYYGSGNWLSAHVDDNVIVITEKPVETEDSSGGFDVDFDGATTTDGDDGTSEVDALLADNS